MKPSNKLFIIRKYVYAPSAREAVLREKKIEVDEVFLDDAWRNKQEADNLGGNSIGFKNGNHLQNKE